MRNEVLETDSIIVYTGSISSIFAWSRKPRKAHLDGNLAGPDELAWLSQNAQVYPPNCDNVIANATAKPNTMNSPVSRPPCSKILGSWNR